MDCPHCVRRIAGRAEGPNRGAPPQASKVMLVRERHAAGVDVDRCPSCRGAFATHDAMKAIDGFGYEARGRTTTAEMMRRAAGQPTQTIVCPACEGETTRREWSFSTLVFVDVCVECRGVWMDGGELEAIAGTPAG